jgi:putative tricarboxylic transport membrane protein
MRPKSDGDRMKKLDADLGLALSVAGGAAAYLWLAFDLPRVRLGDPLGPKVFPVLVGLGLMVSVLLLLLERRKHRRTLREAMGAQADAAAAPAGPPVVPVGRLLPILAGMIA